MLRINLILDFIKSFRFKLLTVIQWQLKILFIKIVYKPPFQQCKRKRNSLRYKQITAAVHKIINVSNSTE